MDSKNQEILKSGGYAKKQIYSGCSLLRWSHSSRFTKGTELVKRFSPESLMDYGCGDGTFLVFLEDIVKRKVGIEIDHNQLERLHALFATKNDYSFFSYC